MHIFLIVLWAFVMALFFWVVTGGWDDYREWVKERRGEKNCYFLVWSSYEEWESAHSGRSSQKPPEA